MDVNSVVTIISTVGFPIAMCVYLVWFQNTTMKEMLNTINKNTEAINKMIERIDREVK